MNGHLVRCAACRKHHEGSHAASLHSRNGIAPLRIESQKRKQRAMTSALYERDHKPSLLQCSRIQSNGRHVNHQQQRTFWDAAANRIQPRPQRFARREVSNATPLCCNALWITGTKYKAAGAARAPGASSSAQPHDLRTRSDTRSLAHHPHCCRVVRDEPYTTACFRRARAREPVTPCATSSS